MAFVIDTKGQRALLSDDPVIGNEDEDSEDDFQFIPLVSRTNFTSQSACTKHNRDFDLEDTYFDFGQPQSMSKVHKTKSHSSLAQQYNKPEDILKNSVIRPGIEKLESLPSHNEGRRQLLRKRKAEREKSAGCKWFNMKAPEMTEEIKNDLEVLKMRSALDPKHFYKNNDIKTLPKYFQIGRVVESSADFYHSRIPKKERKKTLVEELLADAEFHKTTKQRYKKIIGDTRPLKKRKKKTT